MSNSEQFCLRWNNHQSTLVSVFENLLDSNVLIDCTLCAEGKFLKAHRVVLSACSPIFKDMMAIQEDKHPIVFLNDVSFLEMRAMLDYMYKGEVNILQDQLDSFLRTAAALQIKGLTDQGGGGTDEPPAKKGPGRKTGMSDAPESPLVGNAPLREGSMSPTRRRRRVPRRPDSADDQSAENSCDIPSAPQTGSLAPAPSSQSALSSANQSSLSAADLMHHGPASSTPNSASRLPPVRKHEPIDQTQVVKQEYVEEPQEDIEDLTLDDDEDYNDNMSTVSDMAKPGTSFHHSQSNQGDFGVDWNPIMANQSGTDDVFLRATEAINNQSTTQGFPEYSREPVDEVLVIVSEIDNAVSYQAKKGSRVSQNSEQMKRLKGLPYKGIRRNKDTGQVEKVFWPAKTMKPPCTNKAGGKRKRLRCDQFDEETRQHMFDYYWGIDSWEEKKAFIAAMIDVAVPRDLKNRKDKEKSRRGKSLFFYLVKNNQRLRVCKTMFLNTLAITDWFALSCIKSTPEIFTIDLEESDGEDYAQDDEEVACCTKE